MCSADYFLLSEVLTIHCIVAVAGHPVWVNRQASERGNNGVCRVHLLQEADLHSIVEAWHGDFFL